MGTRNDLLVGYSFIFSSKNLSSLSDMGDISGRSPRGQYRCFQWPPPRRRSAGLRTFLGGLAGWRTKGNAYGRAVVLRFHHSPRNNPFHRAEIRLPDTPRPPEL